MARWGRCAALAALAAVLLSGCAGAPPQITSLSPVNGTKGVAADEPILVVFDHAVDHASVAERFHIDPSLPGCDLPGAFSAPPAAPCHVEWRADSAGFSLLHPRALFAPDTTYRFTLDPGIRDPDGVANGLDHHWQIQTGSAPVVRATNPGDGSTGIAVDAPLSVSFSAPMQVTVTAAAIHLVPAVPDTRVVVNANDHSRFVVLPGRLLAPGGQYTLRVDITAADEHGQLLATPAEARFATGGLGDVAHALVVARRSGEAPGIIDVTRRAPEQAGEPPASATLLEAPRCGLRGCPAQTALTTSYVMAAVSPSGSEVAVVERPSDGSADRLILVDVPSLTEHVLAAPGSFPAWSADGSTLAYGAAAGVDLYNPKTGATNRLPAGDPLVAPPVWSADSSILALPVKRDGAAPHVELADPQLRVRYPVPGIQGEATDPAFSPDGSVLALRLQQPSPGAWLVRLHAVDVAAQRLAATLTPIAWADQGTLLAIDRPGDATSSIVRVSVASGDTARLLTGPRDSDLSTVVADVQGRSVGYLLPDSAGVLQAWAMNQDGSNPTQLTSFGRGDGLEAAAVSLGG
jgi:hypothetical protein